TASRRSRVTFSCSDAPSCPPSQTNTFFTAVTAMIATIIVSTEPSGSATFRNEPTSRSCMREIQVELAPGMYWLALNSAFRKGMSSVNENTSNAAATTLHAIVPIIRHECGRRKRSSRRYMRLLPRREQRPRQDALFRRHPAMQEGATIPALILAQLGGIHE